MRRSESHILTTHAGALPRPDDLLPQNAMAAPVAADADDRQDRLHAAVNDVVQRQMNVGLTVVNDGEFGKAMRGRIDYGAWVSYVMQRLTGWEVIADSNATSGPAGDEVIPGDFNKRRDRQAFADINTEI